MSVHVSLSYRLYINFVFYLTALGEVLANTLNGLYIWRRRTATLPEHSLEGTTLLITGANSGIGFITADNFARLGGTVHMACRDLSKAQKAREEIVRTLPKHMHDNVVLWQLDLSSLQSVRDFAHKFKAAVDRIDWMINNAGVMMCPQWETQDGFEYQLATNHLGHFLLTNLLLCKARAGTRIINLSSVAHMPGVINFADINLREKGQYTPHNAYYQSKLANLLFSLELASRLKDTGVSVYAVHPGMVATQLGRHLNAFSRAVLTVLHHFVLITPEQGAQTTLYCALEPSIGGESGHYYA